MAADKSILEAQQPLEDALLDLRTIVQAFADLADGQEPPWLFALHQRIVLCDDLAHAYMLVVHQAT